MMPAVLLTLLSRLQTLIVENNPGGVELTVDPYAGLIANTASSDASPPPQPAPPARSRWRRALEALRAAPAGDGAGAASPVLDDPRTLAHHRAVWNLLGGLDRAAAKRARVQERRRRGDAEIFARFPLYLVPTYPGDAALFGSPGFRAWLPPQLPLVESTLEQIMALER
jgi:hypothetical protein